VAQVVIFTRLTASPGRRDELVAALEKLGAATRREAGAEIFVVHPARDEPEVVLGYEVFADDAALTTHRASEHVAAIGPQLTELLAAPPEITYAS
jgi:quinol monooxygenase YgiN